ncbi:hypothetical protein ACLOJK_001082 [Asimina triloba]
MDLQGLKAMLEGAGEKSVPASVDELPSGFFDRFISHGIHVDLIEPGRIVCTLKVPPRLLNTGNFLHGGATASLVDLLGSAVIYSVGAPTSGVSLEINVSYLDAAFLDVGASLSLSLTLFFQLASVLLLSICPGLLFGASSPFVNDFLRRLVERCCKQAISSNRGGRGYKTAVACSGKVVTLRMLILLVEFIFDALSFRLWSLIDLDLMLENSREEIEIEAKVLRVGRAVGVVSVDLKKKKTGKLIAQGRHTKYLAASSKL